MDQITLIVKDASESNTVMGKLLLSTPIYAQRSNFNIMYVFAEWELLEFMFLTQKHVEIRIFSSEVLDLTYT